MVILAANVDLAPLFLELGGIIVILAVLARIANRFGFSPIPLYLIVGLALGEGSTFPLNFTQEFIEIGAEIGVILLLFMLGLEYSGDELTTSLRAGIRAGVLDFTLSFPPGFFLGLLLGWSPVAAFLLGGVTYISSSGVIAKLLGDLNWLGNRETPVVLSILVLEDLAMAIYLPLTLVLLAGEGLVGGVFSLVTAITTVILVMYIAVRHGERLSRLIANHSNEVVLLTTLGLVLVVAGIAQGLQVSAAIGAFLVGIAISGSIAEQTEHLISPLKDLFAAIFFFFFSLQIDPATILPVLALALALGFVTALTKMFTGYWAAKQIGVAVRGRFRAGALLVSRGEFSIVIAGLGATAGLAEPELVPLAAAYVLLMAIIGPILAKIVDPLVASVIRRQRERGEASIT